MGMIQAMTDFAKYFRDNPWEDMNGDIFPDCRRLYQEDERFFVSKKDGGKLVFIAIDEASFVPEPKLDIQDIRVEFNKTGAKQRLTITFDNENPVLLEQLIIVVRDIAIHCSQFNESQFFKEVLSRLASWSEFLKPSRKGLREMELIGLWGELYMLKNFILTKFKPSEAINFWVGPQGSKQDFTFNDIALEVKTTLSDKSDRIKISSIEQLERTTDKLFLLHVFLNKTNDENSWCLKKLDAEIKLQLEGDLLATNNYINKVSRFYGKATPEQLNMRFDFLNLNIYDIDDDFPGIIASNGLHAAIVKASYQIDPTKISEFLVNEKLEELIDVKS